jgi:lipoate-protein ligase B
MRGQLTIAELGLVEYERVHALQQALVAARMRDEISDTLLLLEHLPVYTLGRGADEKFIVMPRPEVPIVRVSRGGQVTWHGPGQIVAYPILKLEGAERDVGRYLRNLEGAMILALDRNGISAERREKLTGVWVGPRKIGSIGVGIRRWVTYHGLALNVDADLSYFDAIVPCGIADCRMTSIAQLGHTDVKMPKFAETLADSFRETFGYASSARIDSDRLWEILQRAQIQSISVAEEAH